ncbi:39S ribosomal protein L45, mitochondrial [Gopherus evgoodei]|uniref:Large ribosomal subunit protein mL45 n=2 Tax=Gopherus TaxID=38771 RepID=A0A8C5EZQ9_9SAUR|nr:39S ribosomal protein L45, mitochondrial [Gopherus evgoodei]
MQCGSKMAAPTQRALSRLLLLGRCLQGVEPLLSPTRLTQTSLLVPVRTKRRHFIPPSVSAKDMTQEEQKLKARAAGIVVPYEPPERPINLACTAGIFDPYVPPEGDARLSSLSKEGLRQRAEQLKQSAASQFAILKVKDYDPYFSTRTFPEKAQEIFIEAHNCLTNFNKQKLHSLVTERCYPEMVRGNRYKTIRWSFVESLEPPRVVQIRCPDMVNKGNLYGQVTVRMHTRQTLAIYDRFGRLMYGGEQVPKDVLEYVVFERHLVNPYGSWRLHGKIVPAWAPPKDPIIKTVMVPGPVLDPSQEFDEIQYEIPKPKQTQWYK